MLRTLMTSRRQTECRRAASPPSRSACPVTTPSQACGLRSERATGRSHIVLISLKMRCVAVHSEFEIRVCGLCANPDINPSPTPLGKTAKTER
jgi:hypothetical protein